MRYLINDDDLDEVVEYLYKCNAPYASEYLLYKLLVQIYGDVEKGIDILKNNVGSLQVYPKGKTIGGS